MARPAFTLTAEDYDIVVGVAQSLHGYVPKEKPAANGRREPAVGERPGDDFNRTADWSEILGPHGWERAGCSGEKVYWRRPGKDGRGWSATTGFCRSDARGDLLYVFSTSAAPFEPDKSYSKFEALTLLEHGGDFSAAAQALADAHTGGKGPRVRFTSRATGKSVVHPSAEELTDEEKKQDATAADLVRISATIRWAWEGWLQFGVMNIIASEPGIGKTRLCADLARRVYNALPWPDGSPPSFPPGSFTLWVAADNQHPELGSMPSAFGFPPEALYLNTTRANPFGGTMLDDPEDLEAFEARIERVKPALVFIDTTLHATERSSHKPEDAKAFFSPLLQIAARRGIPLVGVTHLNAAGKPLGRRVQGHARVVMQLEMPNPEDEPNRRKLYVVKSNSLFPAPLGVTMSEKGNEYDLNPPKPPDAENTGMGPKALKAIEWLRGRLQEAPRRVCDLRISSAEQGIDVKTLYTAKASLPIREFKLEGYKWWGLTSTEEGHQESDTF